MADAAEITKSTERTLSSSKNHNNNINNNSSNSKKKSKNKKKAAASSNCLNHIVENDNSLSNGKTISGGGGDLIESDVVVKQVEITPHVINGVVIALQEQLHINGHTNGQEAAYADNLKNQITNCDDHSKRDLNRDNVGDLSNVLPSNSTKSKAKSKHKNAQEQQHNHLQKTENHCHATTSTELITSTTRTTTTATATKTNIREQVQQKQNIMETLSNGHDVDATAIALALDQLLNLKSTDQATQSNDTTTATSNITGTTSTGAIPKVKPCKTTAKSNTEAMMANTTTTSSSTAASDNVIIDALTTSTSTKTEACNPDQFEAAITNNYQNKHNNINKCSSTTTTTTTTATKGHDGDSKVHNTNASSTTETTTVTTSSSSTTTSTTTITTDIKATDIIESPPSAVKIEYTEYEAEHQMHDIMRLIQAELSEPYSIYTYRYFIYNWPKLCFLARHGNEYVGAIVCKLDMHMNVRRGYIAMLAVRKEYRKLKIGTTLVQKAIEAMLNDNADEVVLETEMRNVPALRLYENLGFVRDKRLFRYYLNGVDALRLKLWFR